MTITHYYPLDLRHQTWDPLPAPAPHPLPIHQTWDPPSPSTLDIRYGPPPRPPLVTFGGHHWKPVQTCSLEDPPLHWYGHLVVEECIVGKRVVRILMAFLLFLFFTRPPSFGNDIWISSEKITKDTNLLPGLYYTCSSNWSLQKKSLKALQSTHPLCIDTYYCILTASP